MIDVSQAISRYFPQDPISVSVTSSSSSFTAVNTSAFDVLYVFDTSVDCYVKVGQSGIAAASSADWILRAGVPQDFALKAGCGVRVIRAGSVDGTLKIGSTGA